MDTMQETGHLSSFMTVLGVNVQQEALANELALVIYYSFNHSPRDQN
jgi:hypothetical protein